MAKIAAEQQVKLQKERDERIAAVKTASAEKEAAGAVDSSASASSSADSSSAEKEVAGAVDSGASASSTGDNSSAKKEAVGVVDSGASASSSTDRSSAEKEVRRDDSVDTGLAKSVPDTSGKDKGEGRRTTPSNFNKGNFVFCHKDNHNCIDIHITDIQKCQKIELTSR